MSNNGTRDRNMINLVGLCLPDAVEMATINPAKVIKIDKEKSSLARGKVRI